MTQNQPTITITHSDVVATTPPQNGNPGTVNLETLQWSSSPANKVLNTGEDKGQVTVGNGNNDSEIVFQLDDTSFASGWTLTGIDFQQQSFNVDPAFPGSAQSMQVNDTPNIFEYTLHLNLTAAAPNGSEDDGPYRIDPRMINR